MSEQNHVIGWDKAKIKDREQNKRRRLIKESIWIRKQGAKSLNRDEGNYFLPRIYDQLLLQQRHQRLASSRRQRVEIGQSIWESDESHHETVIAGMLNNIKFGFDNMNFFPMILWTILMNLFADLLTPRWKTCATFKALPKKLSTTLYWHAPCRRGVNRPCPEPFSQGCTPNMTPIF